MQPCARTSAGGSSYFCASTSGSGQKRRRLMWRSSPARLKKSRAVLAARPHAARHAPAQLQAQRQVVLVPVRAPSMRTI